MTKGIRGGNIRRGVPVIEPVEVGAASVLHLVGDGGTSRAGEGGDNVAVAGGDSDVAKVLGHRGEVAGGSLVGDNGRELSEVDLAVTAEAEVGGLEISFLGEKEDQAASLACVGLWDVEVERGRDGRGHGTVVGGACGVVGLG